MPIIFIKLDRPNALYIAGETLRGAVEIRNDYEIKVRSIYIVISGAARVGWGRTESNNRNASYSSHEQYLNSQTVLFGTIGGERIKFPPGFHSYNFQCVLPADLPGSMVVKHGTIEYEVKCTIDIFGAIDDTEKRTFEITTIKDLNQNLSLRHPLGVEELHSFCLCSYKPNNTTIRVVVPKGGFVPHETITFTCTVDNQSSVQILAAFYKFEQCVTLTATKPSHKEKKKKQILVEGHHYISPTETSSTIKFNGSLKVPVCVVSSKFSSNIQVEYNIVIDLHASGCNVKVNMKVPIEIGTIPIREFAAPATIADSVEPDAPLLPAPSAPILTAGTEIPSASMRTNTEEIDSKEDLPPSYEDALTKPSASLDTNAHN